MYVIKLSCVTSLLVGSILVAFGQDQSANIYSLGNPLVNADTALNVAGKLGFQLKGDPSQHQLIVDERGATRGFFMPSRRTNSFILEPNLTQVDGVAPDSAKATIMAQRFLTSQKLLPSFATLKPDVARWGTSRGVPDANGGVKQTTPVDRLVTVNFVPVMDGLPVYGPNSKLSCTLGVGGKVFGLSDTLRNMTVVQRKVPLRSTTETDPIADDMAKRFFGEKVDFRRSERRLAYFEQGQDFVQPAYFYYYVGVTSEGAKSARRFVIPAAQNSPESIYGEYEGPNTSTPQVTRTGAAPAPLTAGAIKIGMYVVRNDHPCWVSDAWDYWTRVSMFDWLGIFPSKGLNQYYWDYSWLWDSNNSKNYPGANHFTLIEGHGAPWLITCLQNNADVIHIKNIPGLGKLADSSEINNWVEWHSCDVIPAPGDGFGGDFGSGTVWDVWWHMFQGMKGNLGYRTTMAICDGVSKDFGWKIGLGMAVVPSWINTTAGESDLHDIGWDYGSAVFYSGRDGDSLYATQQLPKPSSLTMWWIHP